MRIDRLEALRIDLTRMECKVFSKQRPKPREPSIDLTRMECKVISHPHSATMVLV